MKVVAGLIAMLPRKTASTTAPDLIGLQSNTVWNSSGSRKGTAPIASQIGVLPAIAAPNVGIRSVRRSSSGVSVRNRCATAQTRIAVAASPTAAASAQGAAEPDAGQDRAANVEPRRRCDSHPFDHPPRGCEGDHPDREVDEEDPAPAGVRRDHA